MLAAVYHSNSDVRIEEVPRPRPSAGEVLVKVRASGICGSDLMEWYRVPKAPVVLGHEVAGRIVEVGTGVSEFAEGDRVVTTHHVPCGDCHYCDSGRHTNCFMIKTSGFDPGGFSQYLLVAAPNVERGTFHLPESVSFERGSFAEPLGCVIRAIRAAEFRPGESVAVCGSGVTGLLCAQYVLSLGAGAVFATDINDFKLAKAAEFGATEVFDSRDDVASLVRERNSGRLCDMVIVCTGSPSAIKGAFDLVSPGGKILFFAPSDPVFTLDVSFNRYWWSGVKIVSSYAAAPGDMEEALRVIESGGVDVERMITHRIGLSDIQKGFSLAESSSESLKIIVEPFESGD